MIKFLLAWQTETQLHRLQTKAGRILILLAIAWVSHHRMPNSSKVTADLMFTATNQLTIQQSVLC